MHRQVLLGNTHEGNTPESAIIVFIICCLQCIYLAKLAGRSSQILIKPKLSVCDGYYGILSNYLLVITNLLRAVLIKTKLTAKLRSHPVYMYFHLIKGQCCDSVRTVL